MQPARKEKRPKKDGKHKRSTDKPNQSSQDASDAPLPITAPTTPGNMSPPSHSYTSSHAGSSKVAIPRLRHASGARSIAAPMGGDPSRLAHACESCRHRKTKCSGERPKCTHCEDFKLQCVYVDGKRDRARKELSSMAEKLDEYEMLLRELSPHMEPIMKERVRKAMEKELVPAMDGSFEPSVSPSRPEAQPIQSDWTSHGPAEVYGEYHANPRAGSTGSVDKTTEDFNRDAAARATGYYGKNADITWLQRLRQQAEQTEEQQQDDDSDIASSAQVDSSTLDVERASLTPINVSTYHCDDVPLSIDNLRVDPYEPPAKYIANVLFQSYLDTVHPSFPILGKTTFVGQYKEYFAKHTAPNDNWLAILNIILAIGAKYTQLVRTDWRGDDQNHLLYFTRARMLGFNTDNVLGHAELQRVQLSGLMAFYLMTTNQISRSWNMSGIAIRHATTLGLNLRNHSKDVKDFSREIRYRVWWAICFLERQLAVMTGRTPSVMEIDCQCPLPLPVDESGIVDNPLFQPSSTHDSTPSYSIGEPTMHSLSSMAQPPTHPGTFPPNLGLYFLHSTKLSIFANHVLTRLYRAVDMEKSWAQTQSTIADLVVGLESLRQQLPPPFDFTTRIRDQRWIRESQSLGFSYYSTMLIINRPSLCRIDRRIANASGKAKQFDQATAARCVRAAINMLKLLPDEVNPVGMHAQGPWWCFIHHLVEAAVVCMLELSFRANHMPHDVDEVFDSAAKAIRWLRSMSADDLAASRAWQMCDEMLRKIVPRVGKSFDDMPFFQQMAEPLHGLPSTFELTNPTRSTTSSLYPDSTLFPIPMFTNYDQMIFDNQPPHDLMSNPTNTTYEDMFPSASEMEAMMFDGQPGEGYLSNQWQPPPTG